MPSLTIVTAAPPTPNGDLHLGHLSGPYSGADICVRARRLQGQSSLYLTGSDFHQSYVPTKAKSQGTDPLTMADQFADEITRLFAAAGFATDSHVRPQHSELHRTIVRDFFVRLHERGALRPRKETGLVCGSCDRYLFEAHVTGKCPHCGATCDGNSCENCALPNQCTDLIDPVCTACGGTPRTRDVERLVFPLSEYADRLRAFHARTAMSPQLEALCEDMLRRGLPDIPVSHPTDWGLPMPVPRFEDQRIYVWAEMLPGYFAELAEALKAANRDPESWQTVWNDSGTEIVQFFGFDNGYFHALLQPALLMAYDPAFRLPSALVTNEFYQLGSSKFSTSRRHAIWGIDLLAAVPASAARFVLAHDRPETERTSFGWKRFHQLVDGELVGTWQRWLDDFFTRSAQSECRAGQGDTPTRDLTRSQRQFMELLGGIAEDILRAYRPEEFSPRRAARGLCELIWRATDFAAGQTRHREASPAALVAEAAAVRTLAQLAYPLMPGFAEHLWRALGEDGAPCWDGVRPPAGPLPTGPGPRFFQPLPPDIEQRVMSP
jgi:methionyl-tRNA synthetase